MGINESGQHDSSATINLTNMLPVSFQPGIEPGVAGGADGNDFPARAYHGPSFDDCELGQSTPAARPGSSRAQCKELVNVVKKEGGGAVALGSLALWPASGPWASFPSGDPTDL